MELSLFDKELLNHLQSNIPICSRPFAKMAAELGTDEETILSRIRELKDAGYLRRIGTFFNSNNLGYVGTLVALKVSPTKIAPVAEAVNKYPEATHNYEREGKYNLWFTLLTRDSNEIKNLPGVEDMLKLKSNKKYKVNVQFNLN